MQLETVVTKLIKFMKARRDVRDAKNKDEERRARNRVHKYKKKLGER